MPYPSVRVLRTLVVVPYSESGNNLGLAECYIQCVGLSIGERDEPHVMVFSGDVVAVYEPEQTPKASVKRKNQKRTVRVSHTCQACAGRPRSQGGRSGLWGRRPSC